MSVCVCVCANDLQRYLDKIEALVVLDCFGQFRFQHVLRRVRRQVENVETRVTSGQMHVVGMTSLNGHRLEGERVERRE